MTRPALHWAAGVATSVLAHSVAGAGLVWALMPDPVKDQETPTSQVQVETYQIDKTAAAEATPDAQRAEAEAATGATVAQGAIPTGRATEAQPETTALPPAESPSQTLVTTSGDPTPVDPATATAEPVTAAAAQAESIAASQAPAATVAASAAPAQSLPVEAPQAAPLPTVQAATVTITPTAAAPAELIAVAQPAGPALAAVTAPVAAVVTTVPTPAPVAESQPVAAPVAAAVTAPEPVAAAAPDAPAAAQVTADAEKTAPATPDATALSPATGDVTRATAELAFAGAEGVTDPVSLAAVQSFMAPETLKPGEGLRDGLAGLLGGIPCSRLQVRYLPETHKLEVLGHIPDNDQRGPLLAALQSQMGGDITVADNILMLPHPQCQALSGIADVGLPQSTDQITNPRIVGTDAHAREFRYAAGQQLVLDLTAPDYDAFVYVDYFDSGGQVIHLSPNDSVPLTRTSAKQPLRIGAENKGDPGLYITIGPPYGQEIAVAFAASEPLYDGTRPLAEPAEPYLAFLAEQVAKARARDPGFKGEWVYFFVTTRAE